LTASGGKLTVVVCRGPTCGDHRGSAALTARLAETIGREIAVTGVAILCKRASG